MENQSKINDNLIREYQRTKDRRLLEKIANDNMAFIQYMATKFNCDIDICYIGFTKALYTYNSNKSKFNTHAYICMKNEIYQNFRRNKNKPKFEYSLNFEIESNDGKCEYMDLLEDEYNLEEDFIQKDLYTRAINLLDNSTQQAIVVLWSNGLTQKEIANKLGISQPQVNRILKKSINIIKGRWGNVR